MRITAKKLVAALFIASMLSGASYAMDNNKEPKGTQSLEELYSLASSKFPIAPKLGLFKNVALLNLSQSNLEAVSADIGSMGQLRSLDLSNNSLRSLPQSMTILSKLKKINLSHNRFSQFPAVLSQLKRVNKISLGYNMLQALPEDLSTMRSLSMLDVSNNQLTRLPRGIHKLNKLKKVNCMYNPCSHSIKNKKEACSLAMAHYRLVGKNCIAAACKLLGLLHKPSIFSSTKMHKILKQVFKKAKDTQGTYFLAHIPSTLSRNPKFRKVLKQYAANKGSCRGKKNEAIIATCKKLEEALKFYEWIQKNLYLFDPLKQLKQKDMQKLLWQMIDENHTASLSE